MADVGIFPSLPGLGWSVSKIPTFQTRIQRAVSGRELRALDYPYPLWQFTLVFNFLRDQWRGTGAAGGLGNGFDELRSLIGFYLKCQGAYGTFLFQDLTDYQIFGQPLPAAISVLATIGTGASSGTGYVTGDIITVPGGSGTAAPTALVTASGGAIITLGIVNPGSLNVVPGTTNLAITGGSGSGANVDVTWTTTTQLVRTMGAALVGGGFTEPITAPAVATVAIYFNGISQSVSFIDPATGIVTLSAPFTGTQPAITADFQYYFRCRFTDDSYTFENFMWQLWQLKTLTFISVLP